MCVGAGVRASMKGVLKGGDIPCSKETRDIKGDKRHLLNHS